MLVKDCLESAAVLLRRDLDEEDFHLAELRVPHLVNALRQSERPVGDKGERERFADRFRTSSKWAGFGKLHGQNAVRENDLELLVQTGGEFFAADGGEIEHKARLPPSPPEITEILTGNGREYTRMRHCFFELRIWSFLGAWNLGFGASRLKAALTFCS